MVETIPLPHGVFLHCVRDRRFKQSCLSVQFVSEMRADEAALGALLGAVLLRGCRAYPDMRAITERLDTLYGAAISPMVRRIGDYQTTGFACAVLDDRFAPAHESLLAELFALVRALLREPCMQGETLREDYVASEKTNLIAAIDDLRNDKRAYAATRLLREMCRADSFGIPRLGDRAQAQAITAQALTAYLARVLRERPVHVTYVGASEPAFVARLTADVFDGLERECRPLPAQTALHHSPGGVYRETLSVAQSRLCLGFTTDITMQSADYGAMLLASDIFGGGQTARLFRNIREKRSSCYDIGATYYALKGLLVASAGVEASALDATREQILHELSELQGGGVTPSELDDAKKALVATLRSVADSPAAIESFYATAALSGAQTDIGARIEAIERVQCADVTRAAQHIRLHSEYYLEGGDV